MAKTSLEKLARVSGASGKPRKTRESKGDSSRYDGWQNFTTGAGLRGSDKTHATHFGAVEPIDPGELEALFYGDDICARFVEDRPEEMFRRGYKLDGTQKADVQKVFRFLRADDKLLESMIWANLHGGAAAVLGVDDGQDPTMPLNIESVKSIKFINVVDSRFAQPITYYDEPLSPDFGLPKTFSITPAFGQTAMGVEIHESRLIRFYATRVDPITRRRLRGWSYSALQRPYDVIRQFANAYAAAAQLMYDAGQGVLKVSKLMETLASNAKTRNALLTRIMQADQQRWSGRMLVVDKNGEDFERKPTQMAGVPDVIDRFMMRLAAAGRIPVTRLMGRSPAGLNATGDADEQMWFDSVKRDQVNRLEPAIARLLMIATAGKWDGKSGENENGVEWIGLEEPDDEAAEKVEYMRAQRWALYGPGQAGIGALTGEQIAAIEFGKKPIEDVVDVEALMVAIEKDNADLKNPPPEPDPALAAFTSKAPPLVPPVAQTPAAAAPPAAKADAVEMTFAQRQAAFLADLQDYRREGLHVDQGVVDELATKYGVPSRKLKK